MAKRWKKLAALSVGAVMAVSTLSGLLAACNDVPYADLKHGTYRTFATTLPGNWNELSYESSVEADMIGFFNSSLIEYDFKFDKDKGGKFRSDGTINAEAIVEGDFETVYSAATKLEDVTKRVDKKWGYTDEQKEEGGYAYKFSLRHDLKWNDGTPIDASDFVYTMQEQLSPLFKHYRYNSYTDQISLKNALAYVNQGSTVSGSARNAFQVYSEDLDSVLIFAVGSATENNEKYGINGAITVRGGLNLPAAYSGANTAAMLSAYSGVPAATILSMDGKTLAEIKADETMSAAWDGLLAFWKTLPNEELDFFLVKDYSFPELDFKEVGFYQDGKYDFVICLNSPLADNPLKADGSLALWAGYYLSGFPLVKKDLYEQCKIAPTQGSTLWTSNYNSSVATTASWGPFMLTDYQEDKSYRLEKNPNWFGWDLEQYRNQYAIDAYTCEKVTELSTRWMGFLNGQYDSIGIDVDHAADYKNSKYTLFTPDAGEYGASLYSNLEVLNQSGRNNSILAVPEFRKAFSLAIDRLDYNSTLYTATRPLLGLMNESYYYDVENGEVYRYSDQGKKAILRTYGYYEEADGTWSNGGLVDHLPLEEAYDTCNGYDLTQARQLLQEALDKVAAANAANPGTYAFDPTKEVTLLYGTTDSDVTYQKHLDYMQSVFDNLTQGSVLEGKIKVVMQPSYNDQTIFDAFKAGEYELADGLGWSGAAYNPFYMISVYIDPSVSYSGYWDTEHEMVTWTLPGNENEYNGAGQTLTMSLMDWYNCLGGYDGQYNWSSIKTEYRLDILAMLEEYVLKSYNFIPVTSPNSASILGAKFSYITNVYNEFMGRGGMRYIIVNYTDEEWDQYVASQGGNLENEYKKSE